MGLSFATKNVTVNGQAAYRKGEYFRKELAVNNTNSALWTNITVAATGQSNVSGNEFVPRTPEQFYYDADGNLTNDGRWQYTWDAENRLVGLTTNTMAGPRQSIKFEYDWRGRRIQKQVWSNTGWSGYPTNDVKFVYDGWNLLAELNGTNNAIIRSYVWGSDLSGTVQGAGGVGGLLKVAYIGTQTTNCFVAFDGNGNVAALADAATTNILAQYEYGPFGEVIRATGPMAKANPFTFSTEYQDDETDLLYYGYRYLKTSTGGWLSRDTIGEHGGANLYAIVDNNPVNHFDALGLQSAPLPTPPTPAAKKKQPKPPITMNAEICTITIFYGHGGEGEVYRWNSAGPCSAGVFIGCYDADTDAAIPAGNRIPGVPTTDDVMTRKEMSAAVNAAWSVTNLFDMVLSPQLAS